MQLKIKYLTLQTKSKPEANDNKKCSLKQFPRLFATVEFKQRTSNVSQVQNKNSMTPYEY